MVQVPGDLVRLKSELTESLDWTAALSFVSFRSPSSTGQGFPEEKQLDFGRLIGQNYSYTTSYIGAKIIHILLYTLDIWFRQLPSTPSIKRNLNIRF